MKIEKKKQKFDCGWSAYLLFRMKTEEASSLGYTAVSHFCPGDKNDFLTYKLVLHIFVCVNSELKNLDPPSSYHPWQNMLLVSC
jgi:hypothetical protein